MEQFRPKTPEELQQQIDDVSELLGTSITQESSNQESLELSIEEIKNKYPERFQIYLRLLRSQKNNQEIDQEELENMRTWISALNNLDSYISHHNANQEHLDFRSKKQLDVFEDIRDSLEEGKKEGYIKLPTGVGKTVLFSRVVESLGLKTLIVVPSKILVGQTGERLEQFTDVEFGKFFQGEKNLSENVTITTYLSLVRGVKDGKINPDEFSALILDEAHKALGEETTKAIDKFSGIKLGFTATPKYSKDKHVSDILEHEIHSMGIVEAAKGGLISRFKSYIAYTDTDLSKVKIRNKERYDENELEKAIDKESRNQSAVELYKKEFNGKSAVAYCGGITHAKHVAELFNSSDVSAEIISGDTPDDGPNGKIAILERFRTGETKVLCNARILIEGFDEPKASVCLNLQPTLSLVDAEQRAGRVLRLDPDNVEKWAYIIDFIDRGSNALLRTFVEIAKASEVDLEHSVSYESIEFDETQESVVEKTNRKITPDIEIDGLRVIVDSREVLSISKEFEAGRNIEIDKFLTLDELKIAVKNEGISTSGEYTLAQRDHVDWPSLPNEQYKDSGWVSWFDLFGKESLDFLNFDELKSSVRSLGVRSYDHYKREQKNHPNWPSNPNKTYKDSGWVSWGDLFGKEAIVFLTIDQLKEEVGLIGISTLRDYKQEQKNHPNWPSSPDKTYKNSGWLSWVDLFNKENYDKLSFADLREAVAKVGCKTSTDYRILSQNHPNWPSDPNKYYESDWISWQHFFSGEEKINLSYGDLVEEVRKNKIVSSAMYQRERKKHKGWPFNPQETYKNSGWVSWFDFLGKEKLNLLSLSSLKIEVQKSGAKNYNEYQDQRKKHKGWPRQPERYYEDWVSWSDLFGRQEQKFIDFNELKIVVRNMGIKTRDEFKAERINHPNWPSNPDKTYKDSGWVSWGDLFGK